MTQTPSLGLGLWLGCVLVAQAADSIAIDPPTLGQSTYATVLATQMEVELAHFDGEERQATTEGQRILARGSISFRLIAAELLAAADSGDLAHPPGARANSALVGTTIVSGRGDFDDLMIELGREYHRPADVPGPYDRDAIDRAVAAVERFNDRTVENAEALRHNDCAESDAALATIFEPLLEVVAVMDGAVPQSHWPTVAEDSGSGDAGRAATTVETVAQRVERIADAAARAALSAEASARLDLMMDQLQRGADYPEFARPVSELAREATIVLEYLAAVSAASWAEEASLGRWQQEGEAVLVQLADPATRAEGAQRAAQIARMRPILIALTGLEDAQAARRVASHVDAAAAEPVAHAAMLRALVKRMTERRKPSAVALPRDLQSMAQRIDERCADAEATTLDSFAQVDGEPDTGAGNAFAEALTDRRRLDAAARLLAYAETVSARSSRGIGNAIRRWFTELGDPARRPDAAAAIDALLDQAARFVPMPFEAALRDGEHDAVVVTGALQDEFLARLDAGREAWLDAWSTARDDFDRGGPPAARLELYHRLTGAMLDSVEVVRVRDDSTRLNDWSAWETPEGILESATGDLPNRLKLATASAVRDDLDALTLQLDRIDDELPVARVVGRLASGVGDALPPDASAVSAVIGQLAYPPTPDAWHVRDRERLALVCRYLAEASHARGEGRVELADAIEDWVHAVARAVGQ